MTLRNALLTLTWLACIATFSVFFWSHPVTAQPDGKALFEGKCAACHKTGLLGAPRIGRPEEWAKRIAAGRATLLRHAIDGFKNMPPKGGNSSLSDVEMAAAVDHMLSTLAAKTSAPAAKAAPPAKKARSAAAVKTKSVKVKTRGPSGANTFNRLMKPASKRNPPPTRDGIHDPAAAGTKILQPPREAFGSLPKSRSGNRVDWVAALNEKAIAPRYDRLDPNAEPIVMDLNIVREVKGSMPDVVYPHKAHTQWLDCSNCHSAIFIPQKGANPMSMAGILLGKQCGVCHGKVAFPVAECRRCHSGEKQTTAAQ